MPSPWPSVRAKVGLSECPGLSFGRAPNRPADILTAMHIVTDLIARPTVLEPFSRKRSLHWPVALICGLVILPLRAIDLDSLQAAHSDEAGGFQYLSKQFLDELRRSSHQAPLAYFETEYFGGLGGQGAAVFQDGELIFGPHWAETGPINHALKPGA
jgi:hypothetical protein